MLTREEVTWAYRYILGREPENEQVLDDKLTLDQKSLREAFFASAEFIQTNYNVPKVPVWVAAEVFGKSRLLWLNLWDRFVSLDCLYDNYEPLESNFIRTNLQPGDVFLDIGANIGWFTLLASTIVGPKGHIHAFEPRSETVHYLKKTIELNALGPVVTVHPYGLSDQTGEQTLAWEPQSYNPGHSFLVANGANGPWTTETVALRRLDELNLPKVDMIKMDVEGAELLVLRGGEKTFNASRPIVLSELFPEQFGLVSQAKPEEFFNFFLSRHYSPFIIDQIRCGEPLTSYPVDWHKELMNIAFIPTEKLQSGAVIFASSTERRSGVLEPVKRQADREDVRACYQIFLDREPETEDVLDSHLVEKPEVWQLARRFADSDEVARRFMDLGCLTILREQDTRNIEVDAPKDITKQLLDHVETVWSRYGKEEAYYSVLSHPEYLGERMGVADIEAFYATGGYHADIFLNICKRNGVEPDPNWKLLEFGCGVGRIGEHFAKQFSKYIGVDISAEHLQIARSRFDSQSIKNYDLQLLGQFLGSKTGFDVFFSFIVLQHNPPPVIRWLLDECLARLNSGGYVFFQVPCYLYDYKFDIVDYMSSADQRDQMEMHPLPQRYVFEVFAKHGVVPIEVVPFPAIGPIGFSYSFFARKTEV
jgi:FkbM family methyltransferase